MAADLIDRGDAGVAPVVRSLPVAEDEAAGRFVVAHAHRQYIAEQPNPAVVAEVQEVPLRRGGVEPLAVLEPSDDLAELHHGGHRGVLGVDQVITPPLEPVRLKRRSAVLGFRLEKADCWVLGVCLVPRFDPRQSLEHSPVDLDALSVQPEQFVVSGVMEVRRRGARDRSRCPLRDRDRSLSPDPTLVGVREGAVARFTRLDEPRPNVELLHHLGEPPRCRVRLPRDLDRRVPRLRRGRGCGLFSLCLRSHHGRLRFLFLHFRAPSALEHHDAREHHGEQNQRAELVAEHCLSLFLLLR